MLAFLAGRLASALLALTVAAVPVALTVGLLRYGVEGIGGTTNRFVGPWRLDAISGLVLCVLALPAAIVAVGALDWLASAFRKAARRLLSSSASASGTVREALAETIGDYTLSIAYWVPERDAFVDERGLPVELPEPGSGRAWTAV